MPQPIRKVALIGFMGSGKSSVAPLLATALSCRWIDVDKEIVSRSGSSSVADIFNARGEPFFRDLETQVVKSLADESKLVISTGGGIIGRPINIDYLRRNGGTIVFLQTSFETVTARISDFSTRPLFRNVERARTLFTERQSLYQNYADLVVETDQKDPPWVRDEIVSQLEKRL